jgi:hypothetical protein
MIGAADGMSFRRYMARRPTYVAAATGAFTQAYRSDPDAPNAQSCAELLDYLRQRGATDEVLRAALGIHPEAVRARLRRNALRRGPPGNDGRPTVLLSPADIASIRGAGRAQPTKAGPRAGDGAPRQRSSASQVAMAPAADRGTCSYWSNTKSR